MSSDFHVQPRELNLRTLHCLFDQSHVALQCSITCIPTCFITMFSLFGQAQCLEVFSGRQCTRQLLSVFLFTLKLSKSFAKGNVSGGTLRESDVGVLFDIV